MSEDYLAVLNFVSVKSLEEAIEKVVDEIKSSTDLIHNWTVLHQLLKSVAKDVKIMAKDIVNICLQHLKKQDTCIVQTRFICKILIVLVEKTEKEEFEKELETFLDYLQFNIIRQSNAHQLHDDCAIDYQTATTVLSLTFPTFVKVGLLKNPTKLLEVISAMIQSKNENSIVESLAFMLTSVIHYESMFETDEDLDKISNHPGLTALCSIADILFSKTFKHNVFQETWFHHGIQRGLSNPAALNRKRSQYKIIYLIMFFKINCNKYLYV